MASPITTVSLGFYLQVKALQQQWQAQKGAAAQVGSAQPQGNTRPPLLQAIETAINEAFYQRSDVRFILWICFPW